MTKFENFTEKELYSYILKNKATIYAYSYMGSDFYELYDADSISEMHDFDQFIKNNFKDLGFNSEVSIDSHIFKYKNIIIVFCNEDMTVINLSNL